MICYSSPQLPKVKHGFFSRQGGVSEGPFSSLNLMMKEGENPKNVLENLKRIGQFIGVESSHIVQMDQVHGKEVVVVDAPHEDIWPQADALITKTPGLALLVRTADCVPIVLADECAGIVGIVHSGWRGTCQNIIGVCVKKMVDLGATTLKAVIGPCIHQKDYEVDDQTYKTFTEGNPGFEKFFQKHENKFLLDLVGSCVWLLEESGVRHLDIIDRNTFAEPENFFSCRYAKSLGQPFGVQASFVMIS